MLWFLVCLVILSSYRARFHWFRFLISNMFRVKWFFRELAIECRHKARLRNGFHTFVFGNIHISFLLAVDVVDLMQISNSAFD